MTVTTILVKFKPKKSKKLQTVHFNKRGMKRAFCGAKKGKKMNPRTIGHVCQTCAVNVQRKFPQRAVKNWVRDFKKLALLNQQRQANIWLNNAGFTVIKPRRRTGACSAPR